MSAVIPQRGSWLPAILVALVVAAANIALWWWAYRPAQVPDWHGQVGGFAFNAFQRYESPLDRTYPSDAELASDIRIMSQYSKRFRTYSSTELPNAAKIAREVGMKVTQGAWLDKRLDNNDRELDALIRTVEENDNIERVIVGNEVILRGDLSPQQMYDYLDRARAALNVPVSCAEPWHVWLKDPKLVQHVDFITVHLLPYWEGVPRDAALTLVMQRVHEIQKAYPGKKILIGEVGWPSNGDEFRGAKPGIDEQAQFLRRFFSLADKEHLDYFVMEAFDQPWKEDPEGRTGMYWGMFDAHRELKFKLDGPVHVDSDWWWKAAIASLLALAPMIWFCRAFGRFRVGGRLFYAGLIQLAVGLVVWSISVPFAFYLSPFDWTMFALLLPAQLAILAVLLCNGFEFTEVIWRPAYLRHAAPRKEPERTEWPFVSIHLACCNEPPEMVIATLDSLAELDYPNFEVLVIDNNTQRDEVWQPVEKRCLELGSRFRFFHLNPWEGFKAGALNFGLKETDPRAVVVGAVDADYVVRPDWLKSTVGYFDDPKVAIVQCPQAHREWLHNNFRRMCNWEYDGFFRIGMHHRNERNAIIQHGTMTLIRREPLVATGNWAQWCICEDAELGLRLFNAGYEAQYVDDPIGKGLTPADYTAFKSQRHRWAFGAMQILRRHWGMMTGKSGLTGGQRFHFLTGWFSWFADALHLIFTLMGLTWTIGMIGRPDIFSMPMRLFLIPVLGFFVCKAVFGIILYRIRVPCGWIDTLGASVASMGLSHAIARGIIAGLTAKKAEFVRTAKSRRLSKRPNPFTPVREEALMFAALIAAVVGLAIRGRYNDTEGFLWMIILCAQSLPYLSAMACAAIAGYSGEKSGA